MKTLSKCVCVMLLAVCLSGCAAGRIRASSEQDSVRVEVRHSVEYIIDTIKVAIPYEREAVVRDTTSHLENDYATSDAAILPDGRLSHSLETRPQLRPLAIQKPILRRDSIVYRNYYREVEVEVERQLTWWQETQIRAFWVMFFVFCIIILWRVFRSKLGAFFKSFM